MGDNAARKLARQLISHWIHSNPHWLSPAWSPLRLGTRIANWLSLYDFFAASADEAFNRVFLKSLTRQYNHLKRLVRMMPPSLNRLKALKGTIYGAAVFNQDPHLLQALLPVYEETLSALVSPEGEVLSGEPEVQLDILRDLIDLRTLLRLTRQPCPPVFQRFIDRMTPIVRILRHGDGALTTLRAPTQQTSSTVIDMVLSLSDVRARQLSQGHCLGLLYYRQKNALCFLDVRGTGPSLTQDGYPSLNFEWSHAKDRIIVQSDVVFETPQTPAIPHNTQITHHWENQDGHVLCEATRTTQALYHHREVYFSPTMTDVRGADTLKTPQVSLLKLRFLLHPQSRVVNLRGGQGGLIQLKTGQTWRFYVQGAQDVSCETIDYAGPYNAQGQAIILHVNLAASQPHKIQWAFRAS